MGCEPLGDGECLFGAEDLIVPARTNDDRPAAHPRYVLWRNQQPGRVRPTEEGVPVERREPGPAVALGTHREAALIARENGRPRLGPFVACVALTVPPAVLLVAQQAVALPALADLAPLVLQADPRR